MKKIIIMPDSFKNTMSSGTVCNVIKNSLLEEDNSLNIETYELADGGEGTGIILSKYLGLDIIELVTVNAFNKSITVKCGSNGEIATFDVASIVGFDANEGEKLNPSIASTFGIGVIIKKLIEKGHKKIYIGLGGSITNDLGLGMMKALGMKFYINNEQVHPYGYNMGNITKVSMDDLLMSDVKIICLSDVKSPLFGPTGAALMFAKQKGATDEMVVKLEEDAKKIVEVIKEVTIECSSESGSGAAGGLGFAFKTFLNAEMKSGIDEIISISKVSDNIEEDDVIITGEGKFDNQSFEGKVISGIVNMAKSKKARVLVVAGYSEIDTLEGIEKIFSCTDKIVGIDELKRTCVANLKSTTKQVYEYLK